jgi:acetyl-CoA C-acetyltransferase
MKGSNEEFPVTSPIPVIIGVGEIIDKAAAPGDALEPFELLVRAAHRAEEDVGHRCLRQVDTLRVVNQISWSYRDLPAKRLRLRGVETIYGPVGGESPVRMLLDAAMDIAAGESQTAMVCGAEALKAAISLRMAGKKPPWSDEDSGAKLPVAEDYVSRYAARYGLINPVDVYPLYENASRAAWHQSHAEAQRESGVIWADMSRAAAANPYAWSGKPLSADEIIAPSDKNRSIAYPYQKFMVAQMGVNQGAAVLLTNVDHARALGIPESRLIYVGSGAGAHEPQDFLRRDRYDHSLAMDRILRRTLDLNGLSAGDVDLVELYSCFPCVPKLARRTLGLAASRALSVAGGLTFFGGPGNNYMTHAITAMVRALRQKAGQRGLLYGNGEFLTKHHAAVLSTFAPALPIRNDTLQTEVDSSYGAVPPLEEHYEGPCTIETYTVNYSVKGTADRGTIIARTPTGSRFLARVTSADPQTLSFFIDGQCEPIGQVGYAFDGKDGLTYFSLKPSEAIRETALLFEKLTPHIALVTLNRPTKRNTINGAVTRLMVEYLEQIEADPEIRVAILTATGDESFCGGADLAEVAAGHSADLMATGNGFAGFVNAHRRKPWIAAVRGFAVGGGTELALACDLIVAGDTATFGLPEIKRGLIAAAGGAYRLGRAMAPRRAMELILTGASLTAREAAELQLVNRVTSPATVLEEAIALARTIAENAPRAVAESRVLAAATFDESDATLGDRSLQAIGGLMSGDDAREGIRAFLEKRPPVWKGQ